jgi:hypothetical protein
MPWDDRLAQERVARLEALLEDLESLADPAAQGKAMDAVEALVGLYGEALARVMERVNQSSDRQLPGALADDALVSHLLLVHDLHPLDVDTRLRQALESIRPMLRSHGSDVELLGVEGGVARLRFEQGLNGCSSPQRISNWRLRTPSATQPQTSSGSSSPTQPPPLPG